MFYPESLLLLNRCQIQPSGQAGDTAVHGVVKVLHRDREHRLTSLAGRVVSLGGGVDRRNKPEHLARFFCSSQRTDSAVIVEETVAPQKKNKKAIVKIVVGSLIGNQQAKPNII